MNWWDTLGMVAIGLIGLHLVVQALIGHYFQEKENFVDRLQRKAKENHNAQE